VNTKPQARLLLVDDDPNTLASLSRAFRMEGYEVVVCDKPDRALQLVQQEPFDLIFSDVVMPGKDGLQLLEEMKKTAVAAPVVMMSGQAHIQMAIRATRLGAFDFLEKPISTDKLLLTAKNALQLTQLKNENQQLRKKLGKHELVYTGSKMTTLMAQLERVAASETRVCILGETGTGKELVARTIHEKSSRRNGPFVTVNCAAIPAELIESELFGHEKGAFTGAASRHEGKFEHANHGTIFLDEIGDMPLVMQTKLLRVLEEGEVERVGGDKPVAVDVRVLVATHRNLEQLVKEGKFRQDLFHRVYVFPALMPPLRERVEDIPALAKHFAAQIVEQNGWKPVTFSEDALRLLEQYRWPGNVRELRNLVERMLLLTTNNEVGSEVATMVLPQGAAASMTTGSLPVQGTLAERVQTVERDIVLAELKRNHYQMSATARSLGLERSHLYKKCEQLGIDLAEARKQGS
jgi:two-component system, NtrC family, nitrogen regulation response regulator NtrX